MGNGQRILMAVLKRLTNVKVEKEKKPGLYSDGLGLYLQVGKIGAKSWIFRYRVGTKLRDMGLGSVNAISLAEARDRAARCRTLRANGVDPIDQRRSELARTRAETAKAVTFEQCATGYIDAHKTGWKNAKHASQWTATLQTYAYPVIGHLAVACIDTSLVLKVLEPMWNEKTETATRLRGRIESVLDWARVRGHRDGDNPARWRGHLDHLLPRRKMVVAVKHHAALPYVDLPRFMRALRNQPGVSARALEFCILTATRTGEAIGARWDEFDLTDRVWIIPPKRMKARREHRVPLSIRCVSVLQELRKVQESDFVFHGGRAKAPLSSMAFLMLLRRMHYAGITAHGFRSSFRDWAAERTNFPYEVAEMALAHTVANKVEAAYRRGDLFDKRRKLAEAWAEFCDSAVTPATDAATLD
jgi:integrase